MKPKIEPIVAPLYQTFVCRRFELPVFDHPLHHHPEVELTYIVSSSGTRLVGDSLEAFEPGDLCLIGPNVPHIYRNPIEPQDGACSEVLHFRRDMAQGFLDTVVELSDFSGMLDQAARGLKFDEQTAGLVGPLLTEMRSVEGVRRWQQFLSIIDLLVHAPEPEPLASLGYAGAADMDYPDQMYQVCQYIIDHFDQDLNHKDMAEMAGYSPAHFSRAFKRATRLTFNRFLLQIRLGHSARLLEETDWTIADIAFQSGFNSLSNFNRRFLDFYKTTPRDYRRAR
ncbi:MAG: helix-turn-helix domain-containing protein [Puniceicoccaceae bacterium]